MAEADREELPETDETDADDTTEAERLAAENRRLRRALGAARRTTHRRTAAGFLAIAALAAAGAALFPAAQTVLLALAGTGAFAGLLTYYLLPERFVAAAVGDRVFGAAADNAEGIVAELGLSDERWYVPVDGARPARLYVPQQPDRPVPAPDALRSLFVTADDARGVALVPAGAGLFREFERTADGALADEPSQLAAQLGEALVDAFELADGVDTTADTDEQQVTVELAAPAFDPARLDTPPASFVACGLAVGLDEPAALETATGDDGALIVRCRYGDA